jgi:putative hydrolase of the HAD superfamily
MSITKYQHIFFDLDKTLWDFDRNSKEALVEIAESENFKNRGVDIDAFCEAYNEVNILMWDLHRKGEANKETIREERFVLTLKKLNIIDSDLAARLNESYMHKAIAKTHLMPHTIEVLDYLSEKYKLHIITNGFEESQRKKINNCGLEKYFTNLITSESTGHTKPDRRIFEFALKVSEAKRRQSIMVGDHLEVDIIGARRAGMDQAYVNVSPMTRREKVTFHVNSLLELKKVL